MVEERNSGLDVDFPFPSRLISTVTSTSDVFLFTLARLSIYRDKIISEIRAISKIFAYDNL